MTTNAATRETSVTIQKVAAAEGREGPQWELHVRWPWTPQAAKFPERCWIDKALAPMLEPGLYHVTAADKGVKPAGEGKEPLDGTQPWMHRWQIVAFGEKAAAQEGAGPSADAPPQEPEDEMPEPSGRRHRDPTRDSIERQVALKAAVEMAGYNDAQKSCYDYGIVIEMADAFYNWLQGRAAPRDTLQEQLDDMYPMNKAPDTRWVAPESTPKPRGPSAVILERPRFETKGAVMTWASKTHGITLSHVEAHMPSGKAFADLTVAELVKIMEKVAAEKAKK